MPGSTVVCVCVCVCGGYVFVSITDYVLGQSVWGTEVAIGSSDHAVYTFDINTGRPLRTLFKHGAPLFFFTFSSLYPLMNSQELIKHAMFIPVLLVLPRFWTLGVGDLHCSHPQVCVL